MDFEALANLSWREALIAIVALLVVYVLYVYLRFQRLKRERAAPNPFDAFAAHRAVAAYSAEQVPPEPPPLDVATVPPPLPADFSFPWNEPPGSEGQLRVEALEREIEQLRREVGGLRAEVLILREQAQREQVQAQVTQNVAPAYNDAMQMAIQGQDAAVISQHCGISRAEAELVVALVRNRE